ncbi:T6SS immunity protein Tli3 family protein [Caballeronia humi]|uniref:Tli3-like domain-containing protein n=1 Tax=Caballeronia humi TaxID=326474 RepID=A0A158IC36_9BURK|nr:hypothetical protein [Caballeronia humi]SAL54128.1 hypothetical protein AWB65_04574 [Caballeronia humi]
MNVAKFALILSVAACTACVSDAERSRYSGPQPVPHYDVPAQVIYRIDDHRYISLENYSDCHHGDTYYNDTKESIRKKLGRNGIENFQGRLINADPTGKNIVIPSSQPPERACSDRGCSISLIYSTDSGRTFHGMVYMKSFDPYRDSKDYTIAVDKDAFYVAEKISEIANRVIINRYPLVTGFQYGQGEKLPDGKRVEFDVQMPTGLHSPSGQERFTCDASIRPSNPPKPQ